MALDPTLRASLTLPAICAPMFLVTGPDLIREACKAGVIGALPRQNARDFDTFEAWLKEIRADLDAHEQTTGRAAAPIAVNLPTRFPEAELKAHFEVFDRYGVQMLITVGGDPTDMARHAHDAGLTVLHDVTSIRFAEKAISAGVDGLICIGAGGGGHSGTISHLALIRQIRAIFDGVIVLAGAVSDGATIRAAEVLGADLAYLGTRFIATRESDAPAAYKDLLVSQTSSDLMYTPKVAGVAANWLVESLRMAGLDSNDLPEPLGRGMRHDHLPEGVAPWRNLWSAGQGIDLIHDIPTVAELVARLRTEYADACRVPPIFEAAV